MGADRSFVLGSMQEATKIDLIEQRPDWPEQRTRSETAAICRRCNSYETRMRCPSKLVVALPRRGAFVATTTARSCRCSYVSFGGLVLSSHKHPHARHPFH